jgi:hypothetical protein
MKRICFYLLYVTILLTCVSCRKYEKPVINNCALHIYGTTGEEQFLSCGIETNGNIVVFVTKKDTVNFNSLEFWKLNSTGEVLEKHIIDSSDYYHFERPWSYGESGTARLPDGSWTFQYTKVVPGGQQDYWFGKTTKDGNRGWVRHQWESSFAPKYFYSPCIYWRENAIELFGTETVQSGNPNNFEMIYKFDLNGNFLDTFNLEQDTVLPGSKLPISQRNIQTVSNYIIPVGDGYATTISGGLDSTWGYTAKFVALCLFDKNGKVKHYTPIHFNNPWSRQANTPPFLLPATDGGILLAGCQTPNGQLFVLKYTGSGDSLWTSYPGTSMGDIWGIINYKGGYLVYGAVPENNKGLIKTGYVAMLDVNGTLLWEYRIGGKNSSGIRDIKEMPNGDIACIGGINSFREGKNQNDCFLLMLHSNGKTE